MQTITQCPACGSTDLPFFIACVDHALSRERFQLRKCAVCSLGFTSPHPNNSDLSRYYEFPEYISHTGTSSSSLIALLYRAARWLSLRWKKSLIHSIKQPGRILDVGCGTGEFLQTMIIHKWTADGVEPSETARLKAQNLIRKNVFRSLTEVPDANYDVITLWHVLEHLPDLSETLARLKELLTRDGLLIIAVPNHTSLDAVHYKEYWAGYDVPRHIWHFTTGSMKLLLDKHGFSLLGIRPMKLDSFYVSLLSEKYLHPDQKIKNLWRAAVTGLKSNFKAKKETNYSSLIFLVKPK